MRECGRKRDDCSGPAHVLRVSTFVWQNVIHLNYACILTPQLRFFVVTFFPLVLLTKFPTQQEQSKSRAEQTGRGATGAILL